MGTLRLRHPTGIAYFGSASAYAAEPPGIWQRIVIVIRSLHYSPILRWLGVGALLVAMGTPFGMPWLFPLLGSVLYNGWHVYNLTQFRGWVGQRTHFAPPTSRGLWGEVLDEVYRLQVRHRKRKRKLARFLRGFQDASAALPIGVVVLGQRGEVDWCNPAAGELLGVDWPRDRGRELANLVRQPNLCKELEQGKDARHLRIPSPIDDNPLEISILPYSNNGLRLVLVRDLRVVVPANATQLSEPLGMLGDRGRLH